MTPEPPLPDLGALARIALPAAQVTCGWAPGPSAGRVAAWSAGFCGLGVGAPPAAMATSALPAGPLCSSPGPERPAIPAPRPGPVRFGCSRGHVAGRPGYPRHGAAPPQFPLSTLSLFPRWRCAERPGGSGCEVVRAGRRGGKWWRWGSAGRRGRAGSGGLWKERGGKVAVAGQAALRITVSGKPNSLRSVLSGAGGNSGWWPARRRMGPVERRAPVLRRRSPP